MARINFNWLRRSTEIPILFAFFSFFLCAPVETNFIIYRTCYASLGYDRADCAKLGSKDGNNDTAELEKLVQPYANVILTTQSSLVNIIPALSYLFVGSWSDRNGRKPVMLFAITGFILRGTVTLIIALCQSLSAWYLLVGSVPAALFGGVSQLMTVMVCYTIDVTDEQSRGFRIGMLEAIPAIGILLGTFSSSFIFSWAGYVLVYGVDIVCNLLSYLYVIFVLSEIPPDTGELANKTWIFSFANITEMLFATFKTRESRGRCVLLATLAISTLCVFAGRADGSVIFQFVRKELKWDLKHYTLFSSASTLLGFAIIVASIAFLHKLLKISELPLMTFGLLSYLSSALIQGFARKNWYIYLAGFLKSFYGIFNPMFRSFVSKLITKDETGKVFMLAVTVDAFAAMLAGPLYTLIYNHTLATNPGTFNFVTAGVCGLNLAIIAIVIVLRKQKRTGVYTKLAEEPEEIS